MGLIFGQTANDQVISMPIGTHTGHSRLTKHNPRFVGAGRGKTILKADGTLTQMFQGTFPPSTPDGQPVSRITVEDCTLDLDAISNVTAALNSNHDAGPLVVVGRRVDIIGAHKNTKGVIASAGADLTEILVVGNGGGFQAGNGCTSFRMRDCTQRGGMHGFICSDGNFTIPGIDIDGYDVDLGYWAVPVYEAVTPTAFGEFHVDVESNVTTDRSLYDVVRVLTPIGDYDGMILPAGTRQWDRLETEDGEWAEVFAFDDGPLYVGPWHAAGSFREISEPDGEATIYRLTLGRLYDWSATRLGLKTLGGAPALAHWRTPRGGYAVTPQITPGVRVDIVRHGDTFGTQRDVDTGCAHITKTGVGARLHNITARRGFSDEITTRASGVVVVDCQTFDGQDMGFTVDGGMGRQTLIRCTATRAGFTGFWIGVGPSDLYSCRAYENGIHRSGIEGYGFNVVAAARGTRIYRPGGDRNVTAFYGGLARAEPIHRPRVTVTERGQRRRIG